MSSNKMYPSVISDASDSPRRNKKAIAPKNSVWVLTPFELPDAGLVASSAGAGAFGVIHLGRDENKAKSALSSVAERTDAPFGVCIACEEMAALNLPPQVSRIILPWGMKAPKNTGAELFWQVHSAGEAESALSKKAKNLILKGSEGAGLSGVESNFLLFQALLEPCKKSGVNLYIQGGVGVHTAAAYLSLGASGVIFDSQLAFLPECGTSSDWRPALEKMNGSEIRSCEGFNYFVLPGQHEPAEGYTRAGLEQSLREADGGVLPLGQDIVLAPDYLADYKRLRHFVRAVKDAEFSQLKIAKVTDSFSSGSEMAKEMNTDLPLAQGPMARISDTPEFLRDVADGGALPFFAMSMMNGDPARKALSDTNTAMDGKAWGVGMLGFIHPDTYEEQAKLVIDAKPHAVIIAGGRPQQAKSFEDAGIKAFLHVPAAGILDMSIKEGARSFVFEGRESGGHVGPLSSAVLWEKQMNRLLRFESPSELSVFFAGGIHDAFSAAFVRVMSSPLAARDVRLGIVCGTAYLCTKEIVSSGAITKDYQKLVLEGKETLLLKSGRGQETRAVPSPYTEYFIKEKDKLKADGMESSEILMKLEELNLGRLRIAAKGVTREDGELKSLARKEQLETGLFMTGAITPLLKKATGIGDIHKALTLGSRKMVDDLTASPQSRARFAGAEATGAAGAAGAAVNGSARGVQREDIAVIGMECIFPGAENLDEYWRNIIFAVNSVTEVPEDRWPADLFYDPDTRDTDFVSSKWGGFLSLIDFDPLEFGITPQSLSAIEPVQLLSLLVAKRALSDAGYTDTASDDLENTSVIFGAQGMGDLMLAHALRPGLMRLCGAMPDEVKDVLPKYTEDSFPGILSNVISGRITNRLNLGGRNYTVDAACASSLAAMDIAFDELSFGKSDMVVLGGADMHDGIVDFQLFSSTYALSKKGRCATFDSDADGIAIGEGVGVLILKRLKDAERDGNKIYAVIKGVGGSSDGKVLGLTAPDERGQIRALERAYERAGVLPSDVGMIEAHGTGTVVGDRTELSALNDVFLRAGTMPGRTRLGSVKSQIGHTKCAAGIAGLIKALQCVRYGLFPPTLNLNSPNSAYAKNGPFSFTAEHTALWSESRRVAGISGFGFGGTNFHVIVENYRSERPQYAVKSWPSELFVFRGETDEEARNALGKCKALLSVNSGLKLRDIAYSLAVYSEKQVRYAIVADDTEKLSLRIDAALKGEKADGLYTLAPVEGKVAFLFPGQGSQRTYMAADIFMMFNKARGRIEAYPEYADILFPASAFTPEGKKSQKAAITDTRNAQPLLGIVDFAIADLMREFGVKADMAAGHSYGELPALCFAGAIKENELPELSRARAESILAAAKGDPGRMAAIHADNETVSALLKGVKDVWAVNLNAPAQTVVGGTTKGIETFLKKLDSEKTHYSELNVACAFHTPILADAEGLFASALKGMRLSKPKLEVWSNTTAEPYPAAAAAIKKRLSEHVVKPVKFAEEVKNMYENGARVFIETGPGGVLTGLAKKNLEEKDIVTITAEQSAASGITHLLNALAKYLSTGRGLNMEKLFEGRNAELIEIDAPDKYKKGATVWQIDGTRARPIDGKLPDTAGKPFSGQLSLSGGGAGVYDGASPESIMMAWLDNMNAVIQDQRDVMLSYLGQSEIMPREAQSRRTRVIPAGETFIEDGEADVIADTDEQGEGALPNILSLGEDELTKLILEIVSDKTGYPIDMLDVEANLETDLSIDSIKKMEIIGGLQDRVSFPEGASLEESFEKFVALKTIKELIELIGNMKENAGDMAAGGAASAGASANADTGATGGAKSAAANEVADFEARIVRMVPAKNEVPLSETDEGLIKGKRFAVAGNGDIAQKVAAALKDKGAKADVISKADEALTDYDGLVFINASSGAGHSFADFFRMVKGADMDKIEWIFAFDDIPGALLRSKSWAKAERLGGFTGLLKTLRLEYPGKRICYTGFFAPQGKESFAQIVTDELTAKETLPEIYYEGKERFRFIPSIESQDTLADGGGAADEPVLGENPTITVLGGAQGITPNLISRIAAKYGGRYILTGRTPMEDVGDDYANLKTRDDIRDYLIKEKGMKQPKEIETKVNAVFKAKQISENIALIEAAGGKAEYHSIDVTDAKALRAFLKKVKDEHGGIDCLIHAAGVLEDKLFRDKTPESFERVYNTKAAPIAVILKELTPDLKLFVMFSSMASSFGNIGQCDYAAGNSVLDSAAYLLNRKYPDTRTVAFNWGPWRGAGMVSSGLEKEFHKRGVALLEPDEGGDFFIRELMHGREACVLTIAGDEGKIGDMIKANLLE